MHFLSSGSIRFLKITNASDAAEIFQPIHSEGWGDGADEEDEKEAAVAESW